MAVTFFLCECGRSKPCTRTGAPCIYPKVPNKIAEAEARGYARGKIDGYKSGVEDAANRCELRAQSHFETGELEKCAMYKSAAFFIRFLLSLKEGK